MSKPSYLSKPGGGVVKHANIFLTTAPGLKKYGKFIFFEFPCENCMQNVKAVSLSVL